jgi:pimeloyl-ACP methyl ester carboxylesterase
MGAFPRDFPIPRDQGGPGAGQPMGGFGGNPGADGDGHRRVVQRIGKAPVLLVHGNGGSADSGRWDMLDLKRMLLAAGYTDELIWAPSYLGPGTVDLLTPHTNNVGELRDFVENVCTYLGVDVVDVIAHSLGCSLMYAVCRGLERRTAPVDWGQPQKWQRLGTFIALAGAFHGLGSGGLGEWRTGGEFMNELLTETLGDGGENPFGAGKQQTPPPTPHNITYFCGVARGDFIDAQRPGTGLLAGAVNKNYNLGSGLEGHEKVKESQIVFSDFLPLLNLVPPVPAVKLAVDRDTGAYAGPLTVTPAVEPATLVVDVVASRLTKEFVNGFIVEKVLERRQEALTGGQTVTLASNGMWQLTLSVAGAADDLARTYWVGVPAVTATIAEPDEPFEESMLVTARTSDPTARLYHSLDGVMWTGGATVTITQDAAVSFIAITSSGIASQIATRSFTKPIRWDDTIAADAIHHFLAGRIDATEYVSYSQQFGFFTPFALYRVDGEWVLNPHRPAQPRPPQPAQAGAVEETAVGGGRAFIRVRAGDPQPGRHPGRVSAVIEASDADGPVTVHYTRDGSLPDSGSASFIGHGQFDLAAEGNHIIACYAQGSDGSEQYQTFHYTLAR